MIRTIVKADKNTLTLTIPNNYVGKEVEIIAFTVDETENKKLTKKKSKKFTTVKVNAGGYKFNRDELNER